MSYSILFIILPLLIFAVVEGFASVKIALIAAAIGAVAEFLFSYFYFGEIDSFSIASIFLVILMGGLAYVKESRRIFYLKPAILSLALGLFLIITYAMGKYVLYDGVTKYSKLMSGENSEVVFANPAGGTWNMMEVFKKSSLTVGVALVLHGALAAFSAIKMNRWMWLVIAGFGSYVFMVLGLIAAFFV